MERSEVVSLLQHKAQEVLGAELGEQDGFVGRGQDSLAVVEWLLDVEEATGVQLTEAEVVAVPSLGALADVILAKQA